MEDGGNDDKTTVEEPLLESIQEKGGFRTLPFILGNLPNSFAFLNRNPTILGFWFCVFLVITFHNWIPRTLDYLITGFFLLILVLTFLN